MIELQSSRASLNSDALAADFSRRIVNGVELVSHSDVIEALASVIARYGSLYEWARGVTQPLALRGRAPVYVAHVPGSLSTQLVVRHAWHGGFFAPFTRDLFRRPTRAPNELRISHVLRSHKISTPQLMAYALYAAGPGLVRFDVASRYIPDSYDFAVVLSGLSPTITRPEAITAIESLLRSLAKHQFTHPDLNVKNVLLSEIDRRAVASVLDVDVMQLDSQQSVAQTMESNVNRLTRSMIKSRRQFNVRISDEEINGFRDRMMAAVQ